MLYLSEILIQEHALDSYVDLCKIIQERARDGEMHFEIDVKPPFKDTPENWEDDLEIVFSRA
jgi:hypothetical protein